MAVPETHPGLKDSGLTHGKHFADKVIGTAIYSTYTTRRSSMCCAGVSVLVSVGEEPGQG